MRVLTERFKDREVDVLDGIKVIDERGWAQVLPDPDEPVVHLYAEGDRGRVARARAEIREVVEAIMEGATPRREPGRDGR